MTANSIDKIREKIRRKDREIVRLLNDRARLSVEVGRIKDHIGMEIFDPAQEHRILDELAAL
ncbi:MAG TPA: chorismate mutase, partial [Syntrophales bacterium]